jgi:hypothetical protein
VTDALNFGENCHKKKEKRRFGIQQIFLGCTIVDEIVTGGTIYLKQFLCEPSASNNVHKLPSLLSLDSYRIHLMACAIMDWVIPAHVIS